MAVIIVVLVFAFIGWMLFESTNSSQVTPPIPGTQPAVVQQLPDMIGFFMDVKICCENHATQMQMQTPLRGRRRARAAQAKLEEGQKLYGEVERAMADVIAYIKSALSRGINDNDGAVIERKVAAVEAARNRFLKWGRDPQSKGDEAMCTCSIEVLVDLAKLIQEWLSDVKKQNEQRLEQLRADLDRCHLQKWQNR